MKLENKSVVAAIVVGFYPDESVLSSLLKNLSPQIDHLILVDNGGSDEAAKKFVPDHASFHYVKFDENFGLGYALNAGFKIALDLGASYVATFDQDSAPPSSLIATLLKNHIQLQLKNINCAAVGPVFYDRRENIETYFPFYREGKKGIEAIFPQELQNSIVETDTLITSGMLIKADVWSDNLKYDEGLIVDYTDTEWCFRARSRGYRLFGCGDIKMGHALSDAPPVRMFGLNFLRYSSLRRFYYYRNTILFCKNEYVSWRWRFRLLSGLAIRFFINLCIDKNRLKSLSMMLKGISSGVYSKIGKFKN